MALKMGQRLLIQQIAQDVLEMITVFSARLYGSRKHKQVLDALREAANEVVHG